jgi:hypothetical protein
MQAPAWLAQGTAMPHPPHMGMPSMLMKRRVPHSPRRRRGVASPPPSDGGCGGGSGGGCWNLSIPSTVTGLATRVRCLCFWWLPRHHAYAKRMVFVSPSATHGLCRRRQSGLLDKAFMRLSPMWQSCSWVWGCSRDAYGGPQPHVGGAYVHGGFVGDKPVHADGVNFTQC